MSATPTPTTGPTFTLHLLDGPGEGRTIVAARPAAMVSDTLPAAHPLLAFYAKSSLDDEGDGALYVLDSPADDPHAWRYRHRPDLLGDEGSAFADLTATAAYTPPDKTITVRIGDAPERAVTLNPGDDIDSLMVESMDGGEDPMHFWWAPEVVVVAADPAAALALRARLTLWAIAVEASGDADGKSRADAARVVHTLDALTAA